MKRSGWINQTRSLLRILISLLLVLSLSACVLPTEAPGQSSTEAPSNQPTQPAEETPAPTEPSESTTVPTEPGGGQEPTAPVEEPTTPPTEAPVEPTPSQETDVPFEPNPLDTGNHVMWAQTGEAAKALAVGLPYAPDSGFRPVDLEWTAEKEPEGFQLIRPVANIEVEDPEGNFVEKFEEPYMQLFLAFTANDIAAVNENFDALGFAYLDENSGEWIRFSDKHAFTLIRSNGESYESYSPGGQGWAVMDQKSNGFFTIGAYEVHIDQMNYAFSTLSETVPGFEGLAFVVVQSWGDRHIGVVE